MLISLVGLPGVGKSTIGRRVAQRLGLAFVDCDARFEALLGEPIAAFFEREGEAAFRDHEQALLGEVLGEADAVVATGGGVVLRADNRRLLRERTVCVYLSAPPSALLPRLVRNQRRPLLRVADPEARLVELAETRDPLYREVAHAVVHTRRRPLTAIIDEIEAVVRAAAAEREPTSPAGVRR